MKGQIGILGWRPKAAAIEDNGGLGRLSYRRSLGQWQRRGSVATEARRRDGGLWRRHARLTICAAPWLTVDSSQYSVPRMNPGFKARGAGDKRKKKPKKFTTASIYVEFKSFLLNKK